VLECQVYWWGKEEPGGVEQYEVKGHLVWIVRNQCSSHEVNPASGHGIDSAVDDTMLKPSYGSLTIARGAKTDAVDPGVWGGMRLSAGPKPCDGGPVGERV
jgi:hypothetical protein